MHLYVQGSSLSAILAQNAHSSAKTVRHKLQELCRPVCHRGDINAPNLSQDEHTSPGLRFYTSCPKLVPNALLAHTQTE